MDLRKTWEKYREESTFNYSVLPESLKNRGECVEIEPKTLIVSRGAFPQDVFFILEGTAAGIREYADGNEYSYFQLDKSNGSIGLLELLARKDRYVATIVSLTKMKLMKINSEVVYGANYGRRFIAEEMYGSSSGRPLSEIRKRWNSVLFSGN